jgi:hypothetical protein
VLVRGGDDDTAFGGADEGVAVIVVDPAVSSSELGAVIDGLVVGRLSNRAGLATGPVRALPRLSPAPRHDSISPYSAVKGYSSERDTPHDAPPLQSAGRINSGAARRYHLVAVTPLDLGAMLTADQS